MSNAERCRRYRQGRHDRDMVRDMVDMVRDMLREAIPDIIQGVAEILRHNRDMVSDTQKVSPLDPPQLFPPAPPSLTPPIIPPSKNMSDSENFDRWWEGYPEKTGKGAAKKSFTKALTKTSLDQLIAGVERYKSTKPLDRPWCNPATWLNQERWLDVPAPVSNGHDVSFHSGPTEPAPTLEGIAFPMDRPH